MKTKTVNIEIDLFNEIKKYCINENITIKEFVSDTLNDKIERCSNNRCLMKWQCIIDMINIDDKYHIIVAKYCEHIANLEQCAILTMVGSLNSNLLPLNLRLISKLDLSKVEFVFDPINIPTTSYSIHIEDMSMLSDLSQMNNIEHTLIEEYSKYLNTKDHIKIYNLVESLTMIKETSSGINNIIIKSRIDNV
jgi:hypothetical protein